MLRCPRCDRDLRRERLERGVVWLCPGCDGRGVGVGLLRHTVARDFVWDLWQQVLASETRGPLRCPSCSNEMMEAATEVVRVDVCKGCQLVWFDRGEFDAAPTFDAPRESRLSEEVLERIARKQAQGIAAEYRVRYGTKMPVEEALLLVPGVLGMPVEETGTEDDRIPWATWGLLTAIALASIYAFFDPEAISRLGLIPRLAFRYGGATVVTAFFLHGGVLQLLSNLYFLAIFGDNVEEFLGRANYVLVLAAGAVAGEAAHALGSDARAVPLVGATGGVAAIVMFYGLAFPSARLRYLRVFRWYTMPASVGVFLWFLANVLGGDRWLHIGDTSPFVYLGGGAVGLALWLALRNDPERPRRSR